ncbi:hypothetical protein [Flavihumibacter petaseus]|uniref:Uncharacterized protein n=1 Tax=Flavihumibacter petaseus NBRC 106054 TaxID=1220578 RepID=A0A0E9MYK2_9BACT|nr:hypothetical protein [Flavihumibacter petaseus]GAO42812.1 hypothetical protein FPE01S_01_18300 [Flavihumibacter petaseus NBRC 106054]
MSNMEQDAKDLLSRTILTISVGSLWLLINSTFGLGFGWFFFDRRPTLGNYIFYVWFLVTGVFLVLFFIRIWKKKFKVD